MATATSGLICATSCKPWSIANYALEGGMPDAEEGGSRGDAVLAAVCLAKAWVDVTRGDYEPRSVAERITE